jgi:hypothetical protein
LKVIQTYLRVFASDHLQGKPIPQLAIGHVFDTDKPENLEDFMYRQGLDMAISRGFALSRHGFIDGMGEYPGQIMQKHWESNPLIGEANWSYNQIKGGGHGTISQFIDEFIRWHSAYAHMYMHADSYRRAMRQDRDELERALRSGGIGYRFVLESAA